MADDLREKAAPLTCRTFDDHGDSICDRPAGFIVWGHLYEKRDKGPKCGHHLPPGVLLPSGFGTPAIYEIPAVVDPDGYIGSPAHLAALGRGEEAPPAPDPDALRTQLEQWQGIAEVDRVRIVTLVDANAKLRDQLIDARDQLAQVDAVVTDWGAGTVHRPRAAAYTRLRAILYPEES